MVLGRRGEDAAVGQVGARVRDYGVGGGLVRDFGVAQSINEWFLLGLHRMYLSFGIISPHI